MVYVMSTLNATPYQEWLNPALKRSGLSLTSLAAKVGMDKSALWKIARGKPGVYSGSSRPKYPNAVKIGEILGDIEGSLKAAGYITDKTGLDDAGAEQVSKYDAAIIAALPKHSIEHKKLILNLLETLPQDTVQPQGEAL